MDVGLRDLKQNLSEFLHRAERGETIRVTDRGTAIAQLGPLPGLGRLAQGIEQGWVRAPTRPGPLLPFARVHAERTIGSVIDEDRGE
jgi:prevent-host-death family protein